jgi:hypothetical protein
LGGEFPRELIENLEREHLNVLKQLRSEQHNACCADCGRANNNWASVNLGVFLCDRCADVHRALGTHISRVKACSGSDLWGPDEITRMQELDLVFPNKQPYCEAGSTNEPSKKELMELCLKKYGMKTWSCTHSSVPRSQENLSKKSIHTSNATVPVSKPSCIKECDHKQVDLRPSLPKAMDNFDFDAFFGNLDGGLAPASRKCTEVKIEELPSMRTTQAINEWVLIEDKAPAVATKIRFLNACASIDPSMTTPQAAALKRVCTDEVWEGFEDW